MMFVSFRLFCFTGYYIIWSFGDWDYIEDWSGKLPGADRIRNGRGCWLFFVIQ